jgi:TolB-like protein
VAEDEKYKKTASDGSVECVEDDAREAFISYASSDSAVANALCESMERQGLRCWIAPRDITPGTLYADQIIRAINGAKILVLVLSKSALASTHVGKEIERASSKRRPIIALKTDTAPLTPALEYFLSESQWIDLEAEGRQAAFEKLAAAVRRHLAQRPAVTQAVPTVPHAAHRSALTSRQYWLLAATSTIVAAALAYILVERFWLPKHLASSPGTMASNVVSDKSIAVLPFADMSEKKDQEYLADGMAEEILDLLAKIPGLTVIGRTSSFQFKGRNEDLRAIGTKLSVAHILEGSVRRSNERVRVTAQLIDARTGAHEWSNNYERDTNDVLKMQDEIAAGIVRALEVTVGAGDLQPRGTLKNMAAYPYYLRGRHAYDRGDKEGYEEAAANFQSALALDPSFADALGELARTRTSQALDGLIGYASGFEEARRLAEDANRLDPTSAVGHSILTFYYTCLAWNWSAAGQESKRALALQPHAVLPLQATAVLEAARGRFDESIRLLNAATEIDPLNAELFWYIGNARYRSNRLQEAEAAFRRVLEISLTVNSTHYELGRVLLARGQLREALGEMELESPDPSSGRTAGLALVYYAMGRKRDSDAALALLVKESPDWPVGIAEVHAFRGETDQALKELDRAYVEKDELYLMKDDPLLKSLESDPRYKAFLRKMNLPE